MASLPPFAAVIVAAGKGLRAGGPVPKQFANWRGKPLVRHSAEAFALLGAHPIVVAIPEGTEAIARKDSIQRELSAGFGTRNTRGTGYSLSLGGGSLSQRLDKAGVAGIITSRPKDSFGTMEIFETYSVVVPTIALSCEDYGLVYRLTENHQHPTVRLNLVGTLLGLPLLTMMDRLDYKPSTGSILRVDCQAAAPGQWIVAATRPVTSAASVRA